MCSFVTSGDWIKDIILMDCVTGSRYDKLIPVCETNIVFLLSMVVIYVLLGNHLLKTINNLSLYIFLSETQSIGQMRGNTFPTPSPFLSLSPFHSLPG